ncbi:hypothetical protein AAC387_Pa12g0657 [Persea americana]
MTVKPISFVQISKVAANAEAVIKRQKQGTEHRRFSFRIPVAPSNKRKDSLTVASTQYEKKKKDNPEYGKTTGGRKDPGNRQPQKYNFKDQEMDGIYDKLLRKGKIQPLVPKRPEEVGRVHDPKYCIYHQIVGRPTNAYSTLRNAIQDLADSRVLTFNEEGSLHAMNTVYLTSEKGIP